MSEYGRVANGELIEARWFDDAPSQDWLPFKESKQPTCNPETQEIAEIAPLVETDGITRRWVVLELAERRPGRNGGTIAPVPFLAPVANDENYVPPQVTLRQFLMAADRSGLLATMEALKVNEAIPHQTRRDLHFFLEYSNVIERHHPIISQLAPVITIDDQPITDAQIDDVFRLAASL